MKGERREGDERDRVMRERRETERVKGDIEDEGDSEKRGREKKVRAVRRERVGGG